MKKSTIFKQEDIIMPKTEKELEDLRQEFNELAEKLNDLTEDELSCVSGGRLIREADAGKFFSPPQED